METNRKQVRNSKILANNNEQVPRSEKSPHLTLPYLRGTAQLKILKAHMISPDQPCSVMPVMYFITPPSAGGIGSTAEAGRRRVVRHPAASASPVEARMGCQEEEEGASPLVWKDRRVEDQLVLNGFNHVVRVC